MTIVTDPDSLDRYQVAVDPIAQTISLRGQDTIRGTLQQTGDSDGTTTFTDTTNGDYVTDSVEVGDVLTIISDPADDGLIIGHYRVVSTIAATSFVVDRTIPASTAADLTYRVNAKLATGGTPVAVSDGVTLQALYSFLKEEWRELAGGLGNAEDLIQFTFPFTAITREQMILGGVNGDATSAWSFAAVNAVETSDDEGVPRDLVRTGGWQEQDTTGNILRRYIGVATLGTVDADAQIYYQQGDTTATPTDMKLTGPANQAVLVTGPDVGPDSGTGFIFGTTTLQRQDGGSWETDNYRVGDYVIIRAAENVANDGTFGPILTVPTGTDSTMTFGAATFTANGADTLAVVQVDHRRFLELRVRKKARTYAQAGLTEIGVTVLEALVNRFPLSHAVDPAILLEDGVMAGDGTATGEIFQQSESLLTTTDGVTETAPTADTTAFTFTSATGGFTATVARTLAILRTGDAFVISTGSDAGSYVVKSVDSDTVVTLWKDPLLTYTGGESTQTYDARTPLQDVGSAIGAIADATGVTGTLTDAGGTFTTDTAIGDRIVVADDIVEIYSGVAAHVGYYKVISATATVITLDTSDQVFTTQTAQSFRVFRPGMFLQRFETTQGDVANDPSFVDSNPDTITRAAGSWVTDGYDVGGAVTVTSATVSANDGQFVISASVALTITLIAEELLTADATDTAAVLAYETGIVRTINSVAYPFHWRLFANSGDLSQIFQYLQWKLRLTSDIDGSTGIERGDITALLMSFASPNGTTLDLFPDDLSTTESNNVTFRDLTGDDRNNAFLVGLIFAVNNNLINSSFKRLVAFFADPDGTPANGDEFDSNGAIIVDDASNVDMDFTTIAGNISRSFDYTNNAQGGRTPDTDANVVVVAIGDDLAQYVLVNETIGKVNSQTIAVGNALERNYST
tara:strand:+ start:33374 stop:36118 length:2745 start_codon:yes stop_codon:yes gene_type:complete